jgi:hypothetical protein
MVKNFLIDMGTVTKKLFNILDKSKEDNLSPETLEYVNKLRSEVETLKKMEEDIVNRAYINGYDDCEVKRNRKMNYFLYTYDMNKLFNL